MHACVYMNVNFFFTSSFSTVGYLPCWDFKFLSSFLLVRVCHLYCNYDNGDAKYQKLEFKEFLWSLFSYNECTPSPPLFQVKTKCLSNKTHTSLIGT